MNKYATIKYLKKHVKWKNKNMIKLLTPVNRE